MDSLAPAFRPESKGMADRLQATYDVVLKQPLPPRLQELLQRLDSGSDEYRAFTSR
jgi:hypothetical protein